MASRRIETRRTARPVIVGNLSYRRLGGVPAQKCRLKGWEVRDANEERSAPLPVTSDETGSRGAAELQRIAQNAPRWAAIP